MIAAKRRRAGLWERVAWWLVVLSLLAGAGLMFADGRHPKGVQGILALALLVGAAAWQGYSTRPLPSLFVSFVYGYILVAVGLGTLGGFYSVPHFDDVLHLVSGVGVAYGGWIVLEALVDKEQLVELPDAFVGLYLLCFVVTAAAFWELFEFAGDKWFHFVSQGRGLDDTMFDMVDGLIGGAVTSLVLLRRRRAGRRA